MNVVNDPLEELLTWPLHIRERVRDVLMPCCWISPSYGIIWKDTADDEELLAARWELARGALHELGFSGGKHVSPTHALHLAEIIEARPA